MKFEDLTIGIEEEYQIIDPKTGELTSYISKILEQGAMVFRDQVKPELLQSQVEVGSHVCRNIKEARQEITRLRRIICEIAQKNNRKIVAAGTHPFSRWKDQVITDKERYRGLVADMRYIARRLLIFGMHIHIGVPDRDLRVDIMNQLTYFLPHILSGDTHHGRYFECPVRLEIRADKLFLLGAAIGPHQADHVVRHNTDASADDRHVLQGPRKGER